MKLHAVPIVAALTVLWGTVDLEAQEFRQRRLDPATSLLIPEIGVIAEAEEGAEEVTFGMVLPVDVRPEANRGVDVAQGDVVLMMNGERVRSLPKLREMYEGMEEGDEIKLALQRDQRKFLVGFAKGAEGDGSGLMVSRSSGGGGQSVRVVRAGGGGDVELLHEARVLLGEQDGAVAVLTVLLEGGDLREGDVVRAAGGTEVGSLAAFREAYGALKMGGSLVLSVERGEEKLEVELTKSARPEGMLIRGGQ